MITPEEAWKAYQETGSQEKAAKKLGVSQSHIATRLRMLGIQTGRKFENGYKCDRKQILADYQETGSQRETARLNGVHQGSVSKILREHFRIGRGEDLAPPKEYPVQDMIARYLSGDSCQSIADDLPIGMARVRQILISNGVQMRPSGAKRGPENPNWKGGGSYPDKARIFAEQYVGRPLLAGTVVHHMNEDPFDNRPENLWVFPNQSLHAIYHHRLLRHQRKGTTTDASLTALEIGGRPLLKLPCQTESEHSIGLLALFGKAQKQETHR